MTTGRFTFRRLTDDDLPMLHAWLNEPGVVRWWEGDDVSWDGVVRDYGSASDETTEHWIACWTDSTSPPFSDAIQCSVASSLEDP